MGVVDLDSVVKKWVNQWNDTDENSTMDIDWHKVHFSTGNSSCYLPPQQHQRSGRNARDGAQNGSTKSQIIFTSNYENKTGEAQSHTFQMERTTEATAKTKLFKGFAKSGSVGIKIDVPDNVSNMTGSFGSEVNIDAQDESTVKHSVTWGLNSTVKAQPYTRTTAELRITETEYECDFDAEIHIRGTVIVRLSDGDSSGPRVVQGDIATILRDEMEDGRFNAGNMVAIQEKKVTWKVSGNLKFKFGISQDTSVSSKKLQA